jgi:ribosomal protein S18 acetylase RimI-like enzyme
MKLNIRLTKKSDYYEISDLGTKSYPANYYEGEESFTSKIKGCYEGCFVADLDGIIGYVISFPYLIGKSYPINKFYEKTENPDCWYIHDLCVSKEFRGKGIAKKLVETVINGKSNVFCLTAVENSENFWRRMGFRSFFELEYCGLSAKYMILVK